MYIICRKRNRSIRYNEWRKLRKDGTIFLLRHEEKRHDCARRITNVEGSCNKRRVGICGTVKPVDSKNNCDVLHTDSVPARSQQGNVCRISVAN